MIEIEIEIESEWDEQQWNPDGTTGDDAIRQLERVRVGETDLKPGDRVQLWPRKGGDIFDLALSGRMARVESIQQDYEDRVHVAVTVDDDPGADLGMLRLPGHRFFFSLDEVVPLDPPSGVMP